jgi:hypothetical protein
MLLSPRILAAILRGEQPATLQLQDLLQNLPLDWQGQETLLQLST